MVVRNVSKKKEAPTGRRIRDRTAFVFTTTNANSDYRH